MDTFFNILKKSLVMTVVTVFTFVILYVPQQFNQINIAEAVVPVTDVGPSGIANVATAASTAITATAAAATAVSTGAEQIRTFTLNGIAWAIAKRIIAKMTGSLVTWINTGFKGKPAFIKDLGGFLLEAADEAAGDYIDKLGGIGSFICSPFKLDIQIALSLQYQASRENKPYEGCTLSGIKSNLKDFVEGNFEDGGWEDWFEITSKPEKYTPYGQLLKAQAGLNASLINAEGKELTMANWGQGFLSGKTCQAVTGPDGSAAPDKCTVTKPGTTIANSLNKALGVGQDELVTADEINEILAALIGQLANKAITGAAGLLGLSAGTGQTYSGFNGGSYVSALNQESSAIVDGAIDSGGELFTEGMNVQEEYNALANAYLPLLAAVAADSTSPDQAEAAIEYNNALSIISKTNYDLDAITMLKDEYDTLLAEAQNPSTSLARTTAIQTRQTEIIAEFSALGVFTRVDMDTSEDYWGYLTGG